MAQLYRKSILDKISSPEQLNKALTVTSPLSWLVLIGISLIIVVTVVWSFVGTIPVTVTTSGVVASPVSTNAVYSFESGTVVSVLVTSGSEVHLGDPILTYRSNGNEIQTLYSDQVGTVSNVLVSSGDEITQGKEMIRISPAVTGPQVVVCYVPIADAKKVERGMSVHIFLDSIDSQTYGHMVARVINIDAYAATSSGMENVLGADNSLAGTFTQDGAVIAVTCEFYPDEPETQGYETLSGYYWSNEKGKNVEVSNGATVTAKIITEEVAPITKLFSKLAEIWG